MKWSTLPAVVIMFAALAVARAGQPGIQPGDIDRSAEPCNDFYQFANGTWRANNPIPPSMSRWSRRWKAGEDAKTQLKDILDPIAQRVPHATRWGARLPGFAPMQPLLGGKYE